MFNDINSLYVQVIIDHDSSFGSRDFPRKLKRPLQRCHIEIPGIPGVALESPSKSEGLVPGGPCDLRDAPVSFCSTPTWRCPARHGGSSSQLAGFCEAEDPPKMDDWGYPHDELETLTSGEIDQFSNSQNCSCG